MPDDALTILTYNVYNHHDGPAAFAERVPAIASAIEAARPDVVCLQEAPSTAFLRSLVVFLSRRQDRYLRLACTEMRRADGWTEHLAVIHPGTARTATVHHSPTGESIGISVLVAGANIRVLSAHLNPRDGELRRAQAEQLARDLAGTGPAILAGDLNAVPGGKTLAALEAVLQPLAPARGEAARPTFPTPLQDSAPTAPGGVLDHILGRGVEVQGQGFAGAEPAGGTWPSDHIGVWARVRVRR